MCRRFNRNNIILLYSLQLLIIYKKKKYIIKVLPTLYAYEICVLVYSEICAVGIQFIVFYSNAYYLTIIIIYNDLMHFDQLQKKSRV